MPFKRPAAAVTVTIARTTLTVTGQDERTAEITVMPSAPAEGSARGNSSATTCWW